MLLLILILHSVIHEVHTTFNCTYDPKYHDSWLLCNIFANTNINDKVSWWDHSRPNYCNWDVSSSIFKCTDDNLHIIYLEFDEIGSIGASLNTNDYEFPLLIYNIDLEDLKVSGEFHFKSIKHLHLIRVLDLEDNYFDNILTQNDWDILLTKPTLNSLLLGHNHFSCDFAHIPWNKYSPTNVTSLKLEDNSFYGEFNFSDFIKMFPNITEFEIEDNRNLKAYVTFDMFNVNNTPYIWEIEMEDSSFYGEFFQSNYHPYQLQYSQTLQKIDISDNMFNGSIDWNIIQSLQGLKELQIDENLFTGYIDWNVIAYLNRNGSLIYFDADDNSFSGYADFTQLTETIYISLDIYYGCNPDIYTCFGRNAALLPYRSSMTCYGKTQCENTCLCTDGNISITNTPSYSPTYLPTIYIQPSTSMPLQTTTILITTDYDHDESTDTSISETNITSTATFTQLTDTKCECDMENNLSSNEEIWDIWHILLLMIIVLLICQIILVVVCYKKRINDMQQRLLTHVQQAIDGERMDIDLNNVNDTVLAPQIIEVLSDSEMNYELPIQPTVVPLSELAPKFSIGSGNQTNEGIAVNRRD